METYLCIDNSGSTLKAHSYWNKVKDIYFKINPSKVIHWNHRAAFARSFYDIEKLASGYTKPQCFIGLLNGESKSFNLVITTDGMIYDSDIRITKELIQTTKIHERIHSVNIFYVGKTEEMNIGLNVIFSSLCNRVEYSINDDSTVNVNDLKHLENLTHEEVLSDNFLISLTTHIYNAKRDKEMTKELRGAVCRLFGRLKNSIPSMKSGEEYFSKNLRKEFMEALKIEMENVKPISQLESQALSLFDKELDLNLSRLYTASRIEEQTLPIDDTTENNIWEELECSIIAASFKLPCLLVKYVSTPIIINKKYHIHPFLILSDENLIKEILKQIEPNLIDYTTYQKLEFDNGYLRSPFTRDVCKGVFALDVSNMAVVKNNCRAISSLFSSDNKVPGNLVIWNLIFMYLICRYKLDDVEEQEKARESIINYCNTLEANLSLTHYCQVFKSERLSICFWFCLEVGPSEVPNTSRNVLRSPFGLELLEFYLYIFHNKSTIHDLKEKDVKKFDELKILIEKAKKWRVWNYLVSSRTNKNQLHFEVMAQEQNYHILNDGNYILVSGKCKQPFKSVLNLVSPGLALALYKYLKDISTRSDNIDNIIPVSTEYFEKVRDFEVDDLLYHVKINPKTCWPFVICPVTKLHWRDCMGDYDVKKCSLVRLFNRFCKKYNKYPETPVDLIIFYNKVCKFPVFPENYMETFTLAFKLFDNIRLIYDCSKYMLTYDKYIKEATRLEEETK